MIREFQHNKFYAYIIAFVGIMLFSSKAVLVKIAFRYGIDAVSVLTLRMLFSLPVYIVIASISTWKQREQKVAGRDYTTVIIMGLLGYYLASFFDFQGLQFISASLERLILFIYPTIVLFISAFILKAKPTEKQITAVVITYLGVFLAFYNTAQGSSSNLPLGAALITISAITYAIYLVGSGQLVPKFGVWRFTSYAMIVSTVGVVVHHSVVSSVTLWNYPPEVYYISVVVAIFCTIIPSILISEAIRVLGSSDVAVLGSIGPVSTIVLATIFLQEQITVYQVIGTIIVIFGITFLPKAKPKVPKTTV